MKKNIKWGHLAQKPLSKDSQPSRHADVKLSRVRMWKCSFPVRHVNHLLVILSWAASDRETNGKVYRWVLASRLLFE